MSHTVVYVVDVFADLTLRDNVTHCCVRGRCVS